MKIRFFFIAIFLVSLFEVISAQEIPMGALESQELKEKLIEKSKTTTSIVSDFEQFKYLGFLSEDIKSTGKLVYKYPNAIKWEYLQPFIYSAIFKNDQLLINDAGKISDVDLNSNKMFKSLNRLIIKSVTGDMFDEYSFKISYFNGDKDYVLKFLPLDKRLQKLIHKVEIKFDLTSLNVTEVKMVESSEDYTLIKFLNLKLNETVSDSEFSN